MRVLEIQLRATPADDKPTRQERMRRLAQYNEDKLRDKGAAFGWWLKAHAEDHEADGIRTEIERLAAGDGRLERAGRRVRGVAAEVRVAQGPTRCR